MNVNFQRLTWENYPSTETPINADNLNRLEEGVAGLYSDMAGIEEGIDSFKDETSAQVESMQDRLTTMEGDIDSFEELTLGQVGSMQTRVTSMENGLPTMVGEQIDTKFGDDIGDNVTSWLTEHVTPSGSAVVVDDTLTIAGAAADAKKAGDEISGLKEDFATVLENVKVNTSTNLIDSRDITGKKCSEAFTFESYATFIPLNWGENTPAGAYKGYFVLNDGTTDQTNLNAIQLVLADENKEALGTPITQGTFNNNSYSMSVPASAKYLKLIMYNWTNYTVTRFGLCVSDYAEYTDANESQRLDSIESSITDLDSGVSTNTEILSDISQEVTEGSFVDFSAYEEKTLFGSDSLFTGSATTRELDITGLGLAGKNVSTFLWLSDSTGYMTGEVTEVQLDASGTQIYPTSGYHYIGHPMLILDNCAKIRLYATANAYNNHKTATLDHAQLYTTGDKQVDYLKYYVPKITSKWTGKKWVSYGDSITAQGRWQPFVVTQTGFTHINAGLGGSAVADGSDQSIASFTDSTRISALPTDADVVTIMGGTNDFNGTNSGTGSPIGELPTAMPFDTTTFIGALCETVRLIQTQCPNALIVLISNAGGRGTSGATGTVPLRNAKGLTSMDYADAVEKVADYLGVPYIDVHGCGINPYNRVKYISDSVHPNSAGGELISRPVIAYFTAEQPN